MRRRNRGIHGRVEDYSVTLVIIGTAAIHCQVEVVDRRTEEELANVIDCFGPGVRESYRSPWNGALQIGNRKSVVIGIEDRAIGLDVATRRIRACSIHIDVGIDGTDQMQSTN